jgi:hypothetical protein
LASKKPFSFVVVWLYNAETILAEMFEKIQSLRPAAVPPSGTASQKNYLSFKRKKSARAKTKK